MTPMNAPEISVIVPIYNGARYLRQTLDALLAQSFTNFELLAIDDGSTDDSAEIVRSYQDDRIVLFQKVNGGLCSTLNFGLERARAPLIARNDQDDLSMPNRLNRELNALQADPEAIALFAFNTKIAGTRTWSNTDKLAMSKGSVTRYEPFKDGCLLGSTMLARADSLRFIGGFREAFYPVDDWDLECRLSVVGKVLVLHEPLVAYRFHADANTYRVFSEMQIKTRWTADCHHRRLKGEPELRYDEFISHEPNGRWRRVLRYIDELARWNMRNAGQAYLDGRYSASAMHLSAAMVLDPADIAKRLVRMANSARNTGS